MAPLVMVVMDYMGDRSFTGNLGLASKPFFMDTSSPMQDDSHKYALINMMGDGYKFTIEPLAEYRAGVMVAGKEHYSEGWQGKIAPYDLIFVWGDLAEPEFDHYMDYWQSDRRYYYQFGPESPFDTRFASTHSSNNHIIPANENVLKGIERIREKQGVILEGYLVNINGEYRGGEFYWRTSLTRKDTGDGSCEVFYVERVQIGEDVFE